MPNRTYGEVDNYPSGSTFVNRAHLAASQVHRPLQAGICGGEDGTESIVVSGGYVDDEDRGTEIIYTGQGGNDPATKRQVADQELTRGNAGLVRNRLEGYPVRVVRGRGDMQWSPPTGLRYDGLFRVADHWHDKGKDGFRIWRYRLVALDSADPPPIDDAPDLPAERIPSVIQRIVRNTEVATSVKKMYNHECQVCGVRLTTAVGPYAEAAHIRALGRPHDGPDVIDNVLCLCPNHHVLFDTGALFVEDGGSIRDIDGVEIGRLTVAATHVINPKHLQYHRETYGRTTS